ncbi:MAG: M23 family metallopeptidase [Bacteroidales bacterium]|jgi:murein DD-endopeptidase MepM/ murein hydrolase activator NlpD
MKQNTGGQKIRSYLKKRLKDRFRFIVLNEETLQQKLSFKLSRSNVFIIISILSVLLVLLTTYIIAFTPLKMYIPGYTNPTLQHRVYEAEIKADSIEKKLLSYELYLQNIKNVLSDNIPVEIPEPIADSSDKNGVTVVADNVSTKDSLLRKEYEAYINLNYFSSEEQVEQNLITEAKIYNFYPPINGIISAKFNPAIGHYGIDIVAETDEAIRSVQDGTVMFADWTIGTGYVIIVQHSGSITSVYKHNSVLLKKAGEKVIAGEAIAIIGNSGDFSSGQHLHFELWIDRVPVNPQDYILF